LFDPTSYGQPATFTLIGTTGERLPQTWARLAVAVHLLLLNQKRCELLLKTSVAAHDSQIKLVKGAFRMSNSMKALLAGAALAGLMTGASAKLDAQTSGQNNAGIKAVSMSDDGGKDKKDKDKTEKHACKGQNSCKGKGGCKASDNGCKGKNSCKGKGGCATDGSKMPDDQPKQDQN
jgi:hypothetical protein